jgi:hypothetical protein
VQRLVIPDLETCIGSRDHLLQAWESRDLIMLST